MLSKTKDGKYFHANTNNKKCHDRFNKQGEYVKPILELAQSYSHDMNNNLGPKTLERALSAVSNPEHLRNLASRKLNLVPSIKAPESCTIATCSNELPTSNFASFVICTLLAPALLVAPPQNHNIEEYVQGGNGLYVLIMYEAFAKKIASAGNSHISFTDIQKIGRNAFLYGGHMIREAVSAFPNLASPYIISENHPIDNGRVKISPPGQPKQTNARIGSNAIPLFDGSKRHNIFAVSASIDKEMNEHPDNDFAVVAFLYRKADELCMLLCVYKTSAHLVLFPFSKERNAEVNEGERIQRSLAGPQCISGKNATSVMTEYLKHASCQDNMYFYSLDILSNSTLLNVVLPGTCSIFSGEGNKKEPEKENNKADVKENGIHRDENRTLDKQAGEKKDIVQVTGEEEEEEIVIQEPEPNNQVNNSFVSRPEDKKEEEKHVQSGAMNMEEEEEEELLNRTQVEEKPKKRKKLNKKTT